MSSEHLTSDIIIQSGIEQIRAEDKFKLCRLSQV